MRLDTQSWAAKRGVQDFKWLYFTPKWIINRPRSKREREKGGLFVGGTLMVTVIASRPSFSRQHDKATDTHCLRGDTNYGHKFVESIAISCDIYDRGPSKGTERRLSSLKRLFFLLLNRRCVNRFSIHTCTHTYIRPRVYRMHVRVPPLSFLTNMYIIYLENFLPHVGYNIIYTRACARSGNNRKVRFPLNRAWKFRRMARVACN